MFLDSLLVGSVEAGDLVAADARGTQSIGNRIAGADGVAFGDDGGAEDTGAFPVAAALLFAGSGDGHLIAFPLRVFVSGIEKKTGEVQVKVR